MLIPRRCCSHRFPFLADPSVMGSVCFRQGPTCLGGRIEKATSARLRAAWPPSDPFGERQVRRSLAATIIGQSGGLVKMESPRNLTGITRAGDIVGGGWLNR